jgi:hypothetical protein
MEAIAKTIDYVTPLITQGQFHAWKRKINCPFSPLNNCRKQYPNSISSSEIHSMIEAVNKRIKYDFLFRHELLDLDHVRRFLMTAVEQYNNRPHSALFGLTPQEVFRGAKPDKTLFKDKIEQAKVMRKAENITLSCHNCALAIEKSV